MFNLNEIEASLRFGKINAKQRIILKISIILIAIITTFMIVAGIISLLASLINLNEFLCVVLIFTMLIILLIIFCYLFIKYNKRDHEINEWLKDAVKCKAKIMRLDLTSRVYQSYQIEVSFEFKGKIIKQISKKFNLITEGYPKIFGKYHNKKVNILYSEKYNEILILKQ